MTYRGKNGFEQTTDGFYQEPLTREKNVFPFRMNDQWTMAQQFLERNGWRLVWQTTHEHVFVSGDSLSMSRGSNSKGTPIALANALAMAVATSVPNRQNHDAESFKELMSRYGHSQDVLRPETRASKWKMGQVRIKDFDALDLTLFRRIRITTTDGILHFSVTRETEFYGGHYARPERRERNVFPFTLDDQLRMTQQFLEHNQWEVVVQRRTNRGCELVFEQVDVVLDPVDPVHFE